jgi:hypothetical protein
MTLTAGGRAGRPLCFRADARSIRRQLNSTAACRSHHVALRESADKFEAMNNCNNTKLSSTDSALLRGAVS